MDIAKRRLLSDYTLYDSLGDTLRRSTARVTVYPYKVHRRYADGTNEDFYMFDNIEALLIKVDNAPGDSIAISLSPRLLSEGRPDRSGVSFTPAESPDGTIKVLPFAGSQCRWDGQRLITPGRSGGFIIAYSPSGNPDSIAGRFRSTWDKLLQERITRMNDLIRYYNPIRSNLDTLDRAMAWITLTTDELITRQHGNGIYAGLPWFTNTGAATCSYPCQEPLCAPANGLPPRASCGTSPSSRTQWHRRLPEAAYQTAPTLTESSTTQPTAPHGS